jgi:hypothetical protein
MTAKIGADRRHAARLRAWIQVREYDLKRLSAEAGIPYRTLQNYISATNAIPATALAAMCRVLNLSADLILFGGPKFDQDALLAAVSTYERQRTDIYRELHRVSLAHHLETLYAEQLYRRLFHDKAAATQEDGDELGLWEWKQPGPLGTKA